MASIADGSFRDPRARLQEWNGRIYRVLDESAAAAWAAARSSGLIDSLTERGALVPTREVEAPGPVEGVLVLESDLLHPVTYPHEWSFSMLKDAALLTLSVTSGGAGGRSRVEGRVGISTSCIRRLRSEIRGCRFLRNVGFSGHWRGYGQFVDHFLGPLLLTAHKDIPFQRYLRGHLDGLPVGELSRLFTGRHRFKRGVLRHVIVTGSHRP